MMTRIIFVILFWPVLSLQGVSQTVLLKQLIGNGIIKSHSSSGQALGSIGQAVVQKYKSEEGVKQIGFWTISPIPVPENSFAKRRDVGNKVIVSQNYPNPFTQNTSFDLFLPHATTVIIQLFDLEGRIVDSVRKLNLKAGYHILSWDGSSLNEGQYYVHFLIDEAQIVHKLVRVR